jgi:microcystin-dependent protein
MDFFLGQIGIYGFNFAPRGWAMCSGQVIPISQNTALYSLIGTTYGGNGQTTFGLPDLRSRTPMGFGHQTVMGEMAGVENVTLMITETPMHTHLMNVNNGLGTAGGASGNVFAGGAHKGAATSTYAVAAGNALLNAATLSTAGGSQPHSNLQPYLTVNYCIATTGIYPSRN